MEKTILKISLIISILGILFLLFLSNFLVPRELDIKEINKNLINQKIKVHGTILKIQDKKTLKILSIGDSTGKINVLCECKNNIKQNQSIVVIGKIQEYQQSLQISADKIMLAR